MKKSNSNVFTLKVHIKNPTGDKLFKTTYNFKRVKSIEEAYEIIHNKWGNESNYNTITEHTVYNNILKAYYGSKRII